MLRAFLCVGAAFLFALFVFPASTFAHVIGAPEPWGFDLQKAYSPVKEVFHDFHNFLLIIITLITLFVLGLLVYVIVRYNARANPKPASFTHNVKLEIIWTLVPVLILVVILVPSLKILFYSDKTTEADLTIKAVGHQWYWSYEYPDHGGFTFDSRPIWDGPATTAEDAAKLIAESSPHWLIPTQQPLRLLEVDHRIVVPVHANIRVLTTADDVIHSWAMPALGVKKDAVPGRMNETWMRIEQEGVYYGQCSEICGTGHGYMPIVVEAVSKEKFSDWVSSKQKQAGIAPPATQPAAEPAPQTRAKGAVDGAAASAAEPAVGAATTPTQPAADHNTEATPEEKA